MKLSTLLDGFAEVVPSQDREIEAMTLDSRKVAAGTLFCALAGGRDHGQQYIQDAVSRGAVAILIDATDLSEVDAIGVPVMGVTKLRQNLGTIASRFYADPSHKMTVIGITGTNGKTSVSRFLATALSADAQSGVIGTLGNGPLGREQRASHTTPDAITVQSLLAQQYEQGVAHVAMEVSSHGLDQARVNGVAFDTAVFTNLSRDHLDYHGDMESYGAAKARLFSWPGLRRAVINLDDPFAESLLATLADRVETVVYGLQAHPAPANCHWLWASRIHATGEGVEVDIDSSWGGGRFHSGLLGRFNVSNALAVLGTLLTQGLALDVALSRMALLKAVPGRMERFGGKSGRPLVVVDYAHTPDALEQVLSSLRDHAQGRLWCVFGCGGERDPGKRPQMGAIAELRSDTVVITNDNPRGESPLAIAEAILGGMQSPDKAQLELDRAAAIGAAIRQAGSGDVVLVAGKGHEDYQEIEGRRLPFDDSEIVRQALADAGADETGQGPWES
ncbi:MAG: UDP-N-acetylmuramoyl-L-alanyl-D-glutamate--2,6-diaminopimelate ligase [Gammaproteobacteria bacterium]|nr:UDP-N-acetylmuramoyl-L-alanyl-D-glutamate--2,6-diaminopimelate ligase [Gammaproteobacteria bacterium]